MNYVRLGTNINDCNPPLGVVDINKGIDVSYFPNPAADFVNFEAVNTIEKITLYTILGQEVLSKDVNAQNLKNDAFDTPKPLYQLVALFFNNLFIGRDNITAIFVVVLVSKRLIFYSIEVFGLIVF